MLSTRKAPKMLPLYSRTTRKDGATPRDLERKVLKALPLQWAEKTRCQL
jgi:hypothetical protein